MGKCRKKKKEKKWEPFELEDRLRIESWLRVGTSKIEIAEMLGKHKSSVYREIKRGQYEHRNSDWTTEMRYSANIAQQKYEAGKENRGVDMKIGNDYALADYIEKRIVEDKYSPEAVAAELNRPENQGKFKTKVCTRTIYNYIDKGVFYQLTNKDLPVKKNKEEKREYHRVQKRAQAGESISKRPEEIDDRGTFGHWEMDSVVGPQGKSRCALIVLTERKTREEIVYKAPDHTSASVVDILNDLEKRWGMNFSKVFRTITVDNGSEFANCEGMEASVYGEGKKRTKIYYCHPYSSWERGSNENQNRLIRRHIPKGTNFDKMSDEEITYIEDWLNHYPRRIFKFRTAAELFEEELARILPLSA